MSSNSEHTDIALKVSGLRKSFKLPHENHSGLKQFLLTLLSTKKRNKGYEIQTVLDGINFEIKKGDFFGIVGRNGSGKSTLLKLLAGIYTPDEGSVEVRGSLTPFIELGVGFNPELTGRENVFLNGALLGFDHKQIEAMYDDIVEFAEIGRFMDQKLKNYSSGMQVRLAFSIAIRSKSDILILDEVLAVGDEAFQKKCNNFFVEIKKDKSKTVVLVTHSMESVRRFCNKAILIEKGEIIHHGTPVEVADEYSRQFIVSKQPTVMSKENRYGTGEVIYENITHKLAKDKLTLEFDIVNKTDTAHDGITMGLDFCMNDDIIAGNDTRHLKGFEKGITLSPRATKHITFTFPNNFGPYEFTLNANITTSMGLNVTDYIRGVWRFDSNNTRYSNAFKILLFPEITVDDQKNTE